MWAIFYRAEPIQFFGTKNEALAWNYTGSSVYKVKKVRVEEI